MKYFSFLIILLFSCIVPAKAQSGQYVYPFLNYPWSTHNAAYGGNNVAMATDGINGAMANPALLSDATHQQIALNYTNYVSDVSVGSVAYGQNFGKHKFGFGIQFVDYGSFEGYNEYGEYTSDFTAKEFALNLEYALQLSEFWNAGLTLKPIYSSYENYSSFAMGVDLGLAYIKEEKGMSLGFVAANIGRQFVGYNDEIESLPLNIMASFNKKFQHAPLRIAITAHDLQKWDLSYTDTKTKSTLTGEDVDNTISNIDMFFRHINVGVDIIPTKNFYLTVGYNHRRGAELKLDDTKSIAGFSFGGGIKVSKFEVGFTAAQYQKGIMSYQFSLSTDLKAFKK